MAKLLSNFTKAKHSSQLAEWLGESDGVFIAVAFLKEGGVKALIPAIRKVVQRGGTVTVVAGLDFCLTEPSALHTIFGLHEQNKNCRLFLFDESSRSTFHPKYYRFTTKDEIRIVIGSANLTAGGLDSNIELSLTDVGQRADAVGRISTETEAAILRHPRCKPATLESIGRYEVRHAVTRDARRKAEGQMKEDWAKITPLQNADLDRFLRAYLADEHEQREFKRRTQNYREALMRLNVLAGTSLSKADFIAQFEPLVGRQGGRLWHSDGLYRQKAVLFGQHAKIQAMIREVRDSVGDSPAAMYERGLRWMEKIKRVGPNIFTEICSTFDPTQYPVLNWNPVTSLHELGLAHFPAPNIFSASEYARYCEVLHRIRKHCGFADLGRTDHFLNYVYWIKKKETR